MRARTHSPSRLAALGLAALGLGCIRWGTPIEDQDTNADNEDFSTTAPLTTNDDTTTTTTGEEDWPESWPVHPSSRVVVWGQTGFPTRNLTMFENVFLYLADVSGGSGDGDGDPTGDGDGDPGDGDPSGDGDGDPMGGDPYNLMGCMAPSQALTLMGVEGAWCAPPCMANNADCPAGPQGTMAVCGIVSPSAPDMMMPDSCVLLCDMMNDACPTGSTCKEVPDQMQPLFVCTYP